MKQTKQQSTPPQQQQEQQQQHQQVQHNPFKRFLAVRAMKQPRSNATATTAQSSNDSCALEECGVSQEMTIQATPTGTEVVLPQHGMAIEASLALMRIGAYEHALKALDAAFQQDHPNKRVFIQYCTMISHLELSGKEGDQHDNQAEEIWEKIESADFTLLSSPPASVKLFQFLRRKKEWRHALRVAQNLKRDAIDRATLGEIFYKVGTGTSTPHQEAVECLEKAFDLMPRKHQAYAALLRTLAASHELTKATAIYEKYLEGLTKPTSRARARLELAECIIADSQLEKGLEIIQQGLNESPNCLPLLHAKAEVLLHAGHRKEALALYEEMLFATEGSLEQTKILYILSKQYMRLKLPKQAMEYLKRELKLTKKLLGKAHLEVARIYSDLGGICDSQCDYEEAIKFYNKTLTLETQELNRIKHACLLTSNEVQMESYDTQMAEVRQSISETKKVLGKIHYKTGNWTGAIDVTGMAR